MSGTRGRVLLVVAGLTLFGHLPIGAGDLNFEDRVKAQEAIERVYYSHQTGAPRPFEELVRQCTDMDGDGYFFEPSCGSPPDCNDADPSTHPGAPERCDGYDNNCDGHTDNSDSCDTTCDLPDKVGDDVRLSDDPGRSEAPVLVWTGLEYGVAWGDDGEGNFEIYFARLDTTGHRIGEQIRITDAPSYSLGPSLAWNGSQYGVAWSDYRDGNSEIYFARLDASGTKIGGDTRVTVAPGESASPSLTWSGTEYGIAWSDNRDENYEVYFARLDAAGTKIGGDARVTVAPGESYSPALTWAGTDYALAWNDDREGNLEIYFARLDPSGQRISEDMRVSTAAGVSQSPSLSWTGSEYGIVWSDSRENLERLFFVRLDVSGSKIGDEAPVTTSASYSQAPRIVWTGSEYAIAWHDFRSPDHEIYFARLDPTGTRIGPERRVTNAPGYSFLPSLRWNGSQYGILWSDERDTNFEIYFATVACNCIDGDGDGTTICQDCDDADPRVFPGAPQTCDGLNNDCSHASWPSVVGTNELDDDDDGVSECENDCADSNPDTWPGAPQICDGHNNDCSDPSWPSTYHTNEDDDDLDSLSECGGDCDDDNDLVFPGAVQYCDGINNDCDDADWPIVPASEGDDDGDSYAECQTDCDLRLTTTGTPPVAYRGSSSDAFLIWTGSQYAAVWGMESIHDRSVYMTRLDVAGRKLGANVFVNSPESSGPAPAPSIVWTGSEYGIAWINRFRVVVSRFDASGARLGEDRVVVTSDEETRTPSLIWNGSEYGLFWVDWRGSSGPRSHQPAVYFARLDAEANKIGVDMRVTELSPWVSSPSAVWNGSGYTVVWEDNRDGYGYGNTEVYFVRIDAFGNGIGEERRITNNPARSARPSLVWTGSGYGVAWEDDRDGNVEIHFARLDSTGTKLGGDVRLTGTPDTSACPSLVWNGSEYGIAWQDARDGNLEIYFAYIDASGMRSDDDMRLTSESASSSCPSLVWTGSNYSVAWHDGRNGLAEIYFARTDCHDCDDANTIIHPGAFESCDGIDNDCDGVVDNAAPPVTIPRLRLGKLGSSAARLVWEAVATASAYDVVRGSLGDLRQSRGDFRVATDHCLANDLPRMWLRDVAAPRAGDGFWYLVRAVNCAGAGTYESSVSRKPGSRDAGIRDSGLGCP